MRLSYKYRLYPTKKQIALLEAELEDACDLYNAGLQERRDAWKVCRQSITYYTQCAQLPAMRKDGCLKMSSIQCAQEVLHRVDRAFRVFFERRQRGEVAGYPRFKSSSRYHSLTFPQYPGACKLVAGDKLRVHGVGHIKVRLHRPVVGYIKTTTILQKAGKWFVCFNVEQDCSPLCFTSDRIGLDVGLSSFVTLSDGSKVDNPRYYSHGQRKIVIRQRRLDRRRKSSSRRRKALLLLQKAHHKVANQRSDFHHRLSSLLVSKYGLIAVEDLNFEGLAHSRICKAVHDAGWASFITKLAYKAERAGRLMIKVDPRGTSQTCVCGFLVPKVLSDRWHHCPGCGLSADRDHVSAQVILQRAVGNLPSDNNVEAVSSCVV